MRVAFDIRALQYPGAHRGVGRYVHQLLLALHQEDLELLLLVDPSRPLPEDLSINANFRHSSGWRPPVRQIGWLFDEVQASRWSRLPVDLIHVTSPFDLSFGWPLACRIPICLTVFDLFSLTTPLSGYRKLAYPAYRWLAWKLGRARHLLTISDFARQQCQELLGLSPNFCTTTELGVNPPRDEDESIAEGDYLLVFPCWPRHKNVEGLLEALRPIADQLPRIVLAGDLPEHFRRHLEQQGEGLRMEFPGRVSEQQLGGLYRGCLGFLFPSLQEGFGLTPLEAMAHGAAVAVSDCPPMNEVVSGAGLLFDPENAEQIRQTCLQLMSDGQLRQRLRIAGRQRASHYTWSRTACKTLKVYRSLLQ